MIFEYKNKYIISYGSNTTLVRGKYTGSADGSEVFDKNVRRSISKPPSALGATVYTKTRIDSRAYKTGTKSS